MNIVIFGATGRTGQHLIEQALAEGHIVTAFARDPGKLTLQHERFRVVQGNVLDPVSVERAMEGQEVVMVALGLRKGEPASVLADGTRNIIQAMRKHGVQRIICVSAAGFLGERADFLIGKALFWFFRRYLQRLFGAMEQQFRELEQSGLDWIAVRPLLLDQGPRKGNYRIALQDIPSHGYRITTADVAEFMLRQIASREYVGKSPAIAY